MQVVFYNHAKRSNSTKLPTEGTSISCVLKDECSITSPVLELKVTEKPNFNYAYIADFGRYYFINNIVEKTGRMFEIACHIDVLQTYKDDIKRNS